jgi:hypothetical protein
MSPQAHVRHDSRGPSFAKTASQVVSTGVFHFGAIGNLDIGRFTDGTDHLANVSMR